MSVTTPTNTEIVPVPNRPKVVHRKVTLNVSGIKNHFDEHTFNPAKLNLRNGIKSKKGFTDEKGATHDSWYGDVDYDFGVDGQPSVGSAAFQWAKIHCPEGLKSEYNAKKGKWERQIMGFMTIQDADAAHSAKAKGNLNGYLAFYSELGNKLEPKQDTYGMEHHHKETPQSTLSLGLYMDKEAKANASKGMEVVAERPPRRYFKVVENDFTIGKTVFTLPNGTEVPWSVLEKKGFDMVPVEVFKSLFSNKTKATPQTAVRSAVIVKWYEKKNAGVNQSEVMDEYAAVSDELLREMEEAMLNDTVATPANASVAPGADEDPFLGGGKTADQLNNNMSQLAIAPAAPPPAQQTPQAAPGNYALPPSQTQPVYQSAPSNGYSQQAQQSGYALPSQTMPQGFAQGFPPAANAGGFQSAPAYTQPFTPAPAVNAGFPGQGQAFPGGVAQGFPAQGFQQQGFQQQGYAQQ